MTPRLRSRTKAAAAASSLAAVAALVTPVAASASGGGEATPVANGHVPAVHRASESPTPLSAGAARLLARSGPVSVVLQLSTPSGVSAYRSARSQGAAAADSAERAQAARVDQAERALLPKIGAQHARVIYRTSRVLAGIAVRTNAAHLRALAALPGVAHVLPLTPKHLANAHAVTVSHTPQAWTAGHTGTGVKIAVIDTGIDYTHKDFGGSGLAPDYATDSDAAHNAAISSSPLTPANCSLNNITVTGRAAKVIDGCDFVGDTYDPNDPNHATPVPDANPIDCPGDTSGNEGHGTHVAGTAAGLGILTSDGSNPAGYGSYNESDFAIGPGTAPAAQLVALRVFGCDGSTLVTAEALDWVAAYNNTHPGAASIKVLNLSLGSDFNEADDPDAIALDALTTQGVLPVVAAGNAGDMYDAAGSPGDAPDVLTVAASDDGADIVDDVKVAGVTGLTDAHSEYSVAFNYPASDVPTAGHNVVAPPLSTGNTDGCDPLSPADAAAVNGKVALLSWDDNDLTRRCGSVVRSANVVAAHATGAIFVNNEDLFQSGITGSAAVPVALLTQTDGTAIRNQVLATPGSVTVTFNKDLKNTLALTHPATTDTPAGFTSRGGTVSAGEIKPDVSAPGVTIFSVDSGTGTQGHVLSGTSMATPHTAGIAADVTAAHSGDAHAWSPEEIKAAVMNTATDDITTGPNFPTTSGTVYSPTRVGAGRVRTDLATTTDVVAFAGTNAVNGPVGVGFGPVAVSTPTVLHRTVTVENLGSSERTFTVAYAPVDAVRGATLSVSPSSVDLPASSGATPSSTTLDVSVTLDPTALMKDGDPTRDTLGGAVSTHAQATGDVRLTPTGASAGRPALRVPVAIAPRPAAGMHAATATVTLPAPVGGATTSVPLALTGTGVANGILNAPDAVHSLVSGLQLGAVSPQLPTCGNGASATDSCILFPSERAGDVRYTGAAVHGGMLDIGVTTYAPWKTPSYNLDANGVSGDVIFSAYINSDADHTTGYEIDAFRIPGTDILVAETYDIANSFATVDDEFINDVQPTTDTDLFNSDAMILPVSLDTIGNPTGRITYDVETFSADDAGGPLDVSPTASIDVAHPALTVASTATSEDQPATYLNVVSDSTDANQSNPHSLLLLHHHNVDGNRAEIVHVNTAQTITLPTVPTHKVGDATFAVAATASSGLPVTLTGSPATVCTTSGLNVTVLSAGTCTLTATQPGNDAFAAATPVSTSFVVTGVPGVTLTPYPGPFVTGQPIPVVVSIGAPNAGGTVTITSGTKRLRSGAVTGSVALLTLPGQHAGSHPLTAVYSGDANNPTGTSAPVTVKVGKGKTTTAASVPATRTGHTLRVGVLVKPVRPAAGRVTGKVVIASDGRKVTVTLRNGRASGRLTLGKGTHTVVVTYKGSSDFSGSSVRKKVTITG